MWVEGRAVEKGREVQRGKVRLFGMHVRVRPRALHVCWPACMCSCICAGLCVHAPAHGHARTHITQRRNTTPIHTQIRTHARARTCTHTRTPPPQPGVCGPWRRHTWLRGRGGGSVRRGLQSVGIEGAWRKGRRCRRSHAAAAVKVAAAAGTSKPQCEPFLLRSL